MTSESQKRSARKYKSSEKGKEAERRYRERTKEQQAERNRLYYLAHRERILATTRLRQKEDPDEWRVYCHRHEAKKLGASGDFSKEEWKSLKAQFDFMCLCCGSREPDIKLTVDHVVPMPLGGTNSIDNIQPLCGPCNSDKGQQIVDYRTSTTDSIAA
jgi:5-methylcytosine-specific restriction endonuclease McrA